MIVPCIILMLGIRMPMAAEAGAVEGSMDGAAGFGIGALVESISPTLMTTARSKIIASASPVAAAARDSP
jgi:hypothetical protein